MSRWTKRRRLLAQVQAHLEDISELNEVVQLATTVPDVTSITGRPSQIFCSETNEHGVHVHVIPGGSDNVQEPAAVGDDETPDMPDADGGDFSDSDDLDSEMPDEDARPGSDSSSNSDLELPQLSDNLALWAVSHKITHLALHDLLHILKDEHPELPKDPRTLLGTVSKVVVKDIPGGSYYHFGLLSGVKKSVEQCEDMQQIGDVLKVEINVDGLPLFKSCSVQFWPILGLLMGLKTKKPFVIGLFCGSSKPTIATEYFEDFVNEVNQLKNEGVSLGGHQYRIQIAACVCDTPARAYVKNVKGHNGYSGCDQCTQRGIYAENRMTFPEVNAPLRTDESFAAMEDEGHHNGPSALATIGMGMVSKFPLDYMHLVCLGVMRKLLQLWVKGPLRTRLGRHDIADISVGLLELKNQVPMEFARKPRSLKELDRWKATEFRQFLLYTGPVVLEEILPDDMYKNFHSVKSIHVY
jgi:hypothetical protein